MLGADRTGEGMEALLRQLGNYRREAWRRISLDHPDTIEKCVRSVDTSSDQ